MQMEHFPLIRQLILCEIQIYKHAILHNYEHLCLSKQFQNI